MRRYVPLFLALLVLCAWQARAADLPIREVILYKSGVAYFERGGTLAAGESARLDFKTSDMNDVLKSLTISGQSGAKVTGLRYDSSEPLDQKLADFPFKIDGQASLALFLDQMKGAKVELKYGSETITGTIISGRVVAHDGKADDKQPEREQLVVLLDSGDLRTLDLAAAGSVRFGDPKLQSELRDYLTAVNQSRSTDRRGIYIDSSDAKERRIDASYMLPAPVWKSSYRLIFTDKVQPTLEGWAIVDNTTGEDWTNVRLAVVSGRPVSFISNLYQPKFVARQTVELPEDRAANPVIYGGAVSASLNGPVPAPPQVAARAGVGGGRLGNAKAQFELAPSPKDYTASDLALNVAAGETGELFEYRFSTPVTVKKDESAMLPFLQQAIGARKLLIYSENYGEHPMNAAELTNSTAKTLDGGPITVLDAGSYAGEALITTLKAGDKRLISYSVDLGTRVTTQFESSRELVREIHVIRGVLTARLALDETKTYTIRNVDQKPKTLIIEHAQRSGYKLTTLKPAETTTTAYRFEVKLAADGTEKFPVAEERVYDTTTSVSSLTADTLLAYIQNKALSETARNQLQQVLDIKRQAADVDAQIQNLDADITALVTDQARIRENIKSLNQVSGQQDQVQKYALQLSTQEATLASSRDRLSDLKKQKTAAESRQDALIEKLEF
jgi:hypothetical protein